MNQLEKNKLLAEAYGIESDKLEITCKKDEVGNIYTHKIIPLNEDINKLFGLCIEHCLSVWHFELTKEVAIEKLKNLLINELYKNYPSKQDATSAAMFKALCLLKGIDLK